MPTPEEMLDDMTRDFIQEVNVIRRQKKQPVLSDRAQGVLQDLLQQPGGAREHLLPAIESGNLQMLMTSVGAGQGMYAPGVRALGVNPDSLEQAGADPAIAYNLNFTLAHESRHARDRNEIVDMTETMLDAVIAKAESPDLPHDYTQIARDYLQRDRVLEQRAELAGLNAHVSRVLAEVGPDATLRDVYQRSPKDMAAYVDVTPGEGMGAPDTYAYKPGFVVAPNGLHVDATHANSLDAMGRYFYDEQNYDWRQGLRAVLDAVNTAESGHSAVRDPRSPPQIDFAALQVGPPPDGLIRNSLQQVVDSSLPPPNDHRNPDHAYFAFLQARLPGASDETVAYAMMEAKRGGLNDASRVVADQVGQAHDGTIWIGGTRGERIEVDPARATPMIKTTQALDTHAFEESQRQLHAPPKQSGGCVIL
ncbi:MAG: hypothetical protein ACOY82_12665 [Pseudomonadota bacterium]